jgi:hypothetical protein
LGEESKYSYEKSTFNWVGKANKLK